MIDKQKNIGEKQAPFLPMKILKDFVNLIIQNNLLRKWEKLS